MTFLSVPFQVDADDLSDSAIDYLRAAIPGWEPADGNLEVWLVQAVARQVAELTAVAADVPDAIFAAFGKAIYGLPQDPGAAATVTTFWTARDNLGYTAPAGTQVAYRLSGDALTVFATTADVVIPAGATSLSGVVLAATEVGSGWNGVPSGAALEMVDALSWVESVTTSAASTGGVDPETDAAYQARLAAELTLSSPRPILPGDFAVLAQNVTGVYRALAINGYNPADASTGNERFVTVVPVDVNGAAVSGTIRSATVAYLDGLREISFTVAAGLPTSTTVSVAYTVKVAAGYAPSDVQAACDAALAAFLSPALWAGGDASPPTWRPGEDKVRYGAVMAALYRVPGVQYVSALTVNGGSSDVTLAGVAPLPAVGTITGTMT